MNEYKRVAAYLRYNILLTMKMTIRLNTCFFIIVRVNENLFITLALYELKMINKKDKKKNIRISTHFWGYIRHNLSGII